jgi:glutamate-ammonia-ligase adenylyltransferase
MRLRLQETARPNNLKRGPGGIVDVEFIAQTLQLKHQGQPRSIRVPGTIDALEQLSAAGCLGEDDARFLTDAYRFLRNVEARLRLMNTAARHDLPQDPRELVKLSRLLRYDRPEMLLEHCARYTAEVRRRFERLILE